MEILRKTGIQRQHCQRKTIKNKFRKKILSLYYCINVIGKQTLINYIFVFTNLFSGKNCYELTHGSVLGNHYWQGLGTICSSGESNQVQLLVGQVL